MTESVQTAVRRVAFRFAYDGGCFDGFARQPDRRLNTVEDALMDALVDSGVRSDREGLGWRTGSRTDRGVSARENVVSFRAAAPAARIPLAVGGRVPGLWPLGAVEVPEDFDPRWAAWRAYRYFLPGRWSRGELRRLKEVMTVFVGTHDFSAFARHEAGRKPQRRIDEVGVRVDDDGVALLIRGGSFLRQQVRRMVAAGQAVLAGDLDLEDVRSRLSEGGPPFDLMPAPPGPLVLWEVHDPRIATVASAEAALRLEEKRGWAQAAARARAALYRALDEDARS